MLDFPSGTKDEPKCQVTHGVMGHLDQKQPPVKRKPFAAILKQHYVQQVAMVLPEELYEVIHRSLLSTLASPLYSRVILSLSSLLEGEFFNEYIKKGNILMLSEGQLGVNNVYSLRDGVLVLHLDKESYERAGLTGKPEGAKGKRGTKPRWIVEINLRLPSMLHGKKGFDRIVYAFKNVLNTPVTWLFADLAKDAVVTDPLDLHFPTRKSVSVEVIANIRVTTPSLSPPTEVDTEYGADFEDYTVDIHEWLSLILLSSPRVDPADTIDTFLSRYTPPLGKSPTDMTVVKIVWRGFMSPSWVNQTFSAILHAAPPTTWFSYSVDGFDGGLMGESKSCTILKLPESPKEYILWEFL